MILKPTRWWHIIYCTTELWLKMIKVWITYVSRKVNHHYLFLIPVIDVERYIVFFYVNMKILINILNFKLSDFSVAMLLHIISPTWLGNRYICLLQNNDAFIFMFILKVCCLGTLGELNISRQLAHTILTEMKTVNIKIIIVRL